MISYCNITRGRIGVDLQNHMIMIGHDRIAHDIDTEDLGEF